MSRTLPFPRRGRLFIFDSYKAMKSWSVPDLGGLLLEIGAPLALRGEAVHMGAVIEGLLRGGDVGRLPAPGFQRRILQRARVGESERPRQALHRRHRIEVRGRRLVGLAARQEHDAG